MQLSVIIPAYNEEAGIGRVLRELAQSPDAGPDLRIVVAPNGCSDNTAEVAHAYGVTVVDVPVASKTAAMNAADAVVAGPRVYLDADIAADPTLIRALGAALEEPGVHAAVPRAEVDLDGSSWPVRAYYAINARLPVFVGRLFGRGCIALSAEGRARFAEFPDLIADDMFLDGMLRTGEKRQIDAVVRVPAPRRLGDLVRRVARARAGNKQYFAWQSAHGRSYGVVTDPVATSSRSSWLRDVVLRSPKLWPAALGYVMVILLAEARLRSPRWNPASGWGRPATASGPGGGFGPAAGSGPTAASGPAASGTVAASGAAGASDSAAASVPAQAAPPAAERAEDRGAGTPRVG
ncbi:glycosyltransferase family 2 protein [Rhizomonospora bruguierae]|uniref:glycosyltransferase family 2 protein n=1 Tax=Rhizomonospora bruguierae TaxID=1581705 RepID=UPI001BCB47D4|nr:glycosyltransferase [Micromonospora sp. NBRC 107566]